MLDLKRELTHGILMNGAVKQGFGNHNSKLRSKHFLSQRIHRAL